MDVMELKQNFGIYKNIGGTPEGYIADMSAWGRMLERQHRLPSRWCIKDNKIHVLGDADLRGFKLEYPFGVVAGYVECDESEKNSENYPEHIGELLNV